MARMETLVAIPRRDVRGGRSGWTHASRAGTGVHRRRRTGAMMVMSDAPNGEASRPGDSARRLRFDDLTAIVLRNSPGTKRAAMSLLEPGHSGRLFVLAAGVTILFVWGTLYLVFREWRDRIPPADTLRQDAGCCRDRTTPGALSAQGRSRCLARRRGSNACHAAYGDRLQLARRQSDGCAPQ